MIDEDALTTALIAKLAANDLNAVDEYTTQRSSAGQANRLDPMSFIPQRRPVQQQQDTQLQQRILEEANRMAESMHPLPPPPSPPPISIEQVQQPLGAQGTNVDLSGLNDTLKSMLQVFTSIDETLKGITKLAKSI